MKILRGVGKTILAFMLTVIVLSVAAFSILCLSVDRYGRTDRVQPADVIVVLGASVLPDGQPGPNLMPRTEQAAALYHDGLAPYMICAGGIAGDPLSAAAVARRTAIELGVPAGAVFAADGSNNTREDVRRAVEIMEMRNWSTAIVVSHPMHLLRARMLFDHAQVATYSSPTSTDVDQIPFRWRAFYALREAGLIVLDRLYPEGEIADWAYAIYYWLRDVGLDVRIG
jgi:uncharacterized SAM-binding protein YcdF (DUF218 family)